MDIAHSRDLTQHSVLSLPLYNKYIEDYELTTIQFDLIHFNYTEPALTHSTVQIEYSSVKYSTVKYSTVK